MKETETGKHVIGYHRSFHHLYGVGNTDVIDIRASSLSRSVSANLTRFQQTLKEDIKWGVPIEVGRLCDPPLNNAESVSI